MKMIFTNDIDIKLTNELIELVHLRDTFLDSWYENSESEDFYELEPKEIEILTTKIISFIKEHYNKLSTETIIESITHLGNSPSILYDDDGNFAIECDGCQTVSLDKNSDCHMMFTVSSEKWKPSIRDALTEFINNL